MSTKIDTDGELIETAGVDSAGGSGREPGWRARRAAVGGRGRDQLPIDLPDVVTDRLSDEVIDELLAGARSEEEIVGPGGVLAQYGVAHTTLGRWLARPAVARQLRELARRLPAVGAGHAASSGNARGAHELLRKAAEQHATTMRASSCPVHGQAAADVRVVEGAGEYRIEASFCCQRAKERALRALHSEADSHLTSVDRERAARPQ